ncbi:MAG: transketolase [Candidatus Liptonbacteria bacterium RIFOXYB1_FULL_36_10]|uniref:Transketolase n=1 Tax=Candidatus Liptonbacteria bacterium RIFOXYB1_FULL_36_10 TaxID=1798654 RepID=A0A1G2CP42_9BACT|nr:MAG: transketolase [Candidatus Liptonbacteria bacterium RIFOXYB1_FULL_36_10]
MPELTDKKVKNLELLANTIRQDIIEMLVLAGSGHVAGSLGMADVFSALYFHILNHNPKKPNWSSRDRVILSNGHICPVLYASLARAGYFPLEELKKLRSTHSRLEGHPHFSSLPGIENTSGPLGSGLSQAIGIALAFRLDNLKNRIFCLMSDGEHDTGNTWEAIMSAGKYRLNNLTAIIDRNNIQIDGFTEDVMPLESLRAKYESFNWHILEIDGHNIEAIIDAVNEAKAIYEKPTAIIAHTIPGRGVGFMEHDFSWHGKPPTEREARAALLELRTLSGRLKEE